jgi:hypothetical protein
VCGKHNTGLQEIEGKDVKGSKKNRLPCALLIKHNSMTVYGAVEV